MEQLHIQKEKMLELMLNIGYSDSLVKKNRLVVDRFINYLNQNNLDLNIGSATSFIENYYSICPRSRSKKHCTINAKRATFKFIRFTQTGEINSRWVPKQRELLGPHSLIFNNFIEDERKRLKYSTLNEYILVVREFNDYLNSNNILTITSKNITNYFIDYAKDSTHPHAFYHRTIIIKKLFAYLFKNNLINEDLSKAVPKAKYKRTKELPSVYTNEEVSKILNSIDRNSNIGKRNYAMISLATFLGLRAGDIINLKFENINWENNYIQLIMGKTDKEITLPLLPEVGNAILDYIKNARRSCSLKEVFVTDNGTITPLTSSTLYSAVKKSITIANINSKERKTGPHALRHSLATRMLKQGQPLPVISETLGHSNSEVTTVYTSIDFNSLKDCALEVLPLKSKVYSGGKQHVS